MATSLSKVSVNCDASGLVAHLVAMESKLHPGDRLAEVSQHLFSILDLRREIACVNANDGSTGASKILIRLEPSDRLRRISSAILAGDIDALVVEHKNLSV